MLCPRGLGHVACSARCPSVQTRASSSEGPEGGEGLATRMSSGWAWWGMGYGCLCRCGHLPGSVVPGLGQRLY